MGKLKTINQFIAQAIQKHGIIYDYSAVDYVNAHKKIKIICKIHGCFLQEPNEHLKGCGCPKCAVYSKKHPNAKLTKEEFITKANIVHNNKYSYEKVSYITSKINITISCDKHGDFQQTPNAHLSGRGCPICASSKGELIITKYLKENNICFVKEKIFKTKPPYNKLRFDFYIQSHNLIIEFNGLQHYKPTSFFGTKRKFEKQVDSDMRKVSFCKLNNIRLLVIPYYKIDQIPKILDGIMMPTAR